MSEEELSGLRRLAQGARDFLYGMAGHDMTRFALKTRGSMEHLFILSLIHISEPTRPY